MRYVSFVQQFVIPYVGTVQSQNICLSDVDNDGDHELIIGHWESGSLDKENEISYGEVHVFKGQDKKPWRCARNLGIITVVHVGDCFNISQNRLLVLCSDSKCYVFDANEVSGDVTPDKSAGFCPTMAIQHHQTMPPNAMRLLVDDIDGDKQQELLVAYSDRVVRSFRWSMLTDKFEMIQEWVLAGQIGTIAVHRDAAQVAHVLVSQPGGTFVTLKVKSTILSESISKSVSQVEYHPLSSARARNVFVRTEVVGNIRRSRTNAGDAPPYYALCTIDGTLSLFEHGDRLIWSLQTSHQLFGLQKLDLTNDEAEEVIITSWDGMTYIVNHHREKVHFQFPRPCQAFCAGKYALSKGKNEYAFVYATCDDELVMYYGVSLVEIPCKSVLHDLYSRTHLLEMMRKLGVDTTDKAQIRNAIKYLVYEYPADSESKSETPTSSTTDS